MTKAPQYVYMFDQWWGFDRVVQIDFADTDKKYLETDGAISQGDCIQIGDVIGLCLGESIAFQELYKKEYTIQHQVSHIYKGLLSANAIDFLHNFVEYRFTTYKNAIPLFLGSSIDAIIKRKPAKSTKPTRKEQTVIIYPTLWALMQEESLEDESTLIIHGGSTPVQKAKAFWKVKMGKIERVAITYSQIFHDRANLQEIQLKQQHAWWYKNQRDPRYYLPTVLRNIQEHFSRKEPITMKTTGLKFAE